MKFLSEHVFQPVTMTVASVPVTGVGVWLWVERATSLFALVSAATGAIMGVFGVIWWIRRFRKDHATTTNKPSSGRSFTRWLRDLVDRWKR